ncbi:serine/threonine-protein kinase [Gemmatimonas groenlandica]|uniref:Serine/threonine protein kinase n=1 Tax=Gemmatimonas groenlandica TaxID=2732249 RepID=A0A6M4IM70_9BACT|nr:serine/threonine-protein kinase [Gemmatimonas groenlandica]QJR35783.1 serine/threonine protein kinase [Gemmatimonas groenlandica]
MSQPKICPRCGEAYDDVVDFCAKDGTRLVRGAPSVDLIGTVIADRYRIVSRIGEGGMGQVYLAEHVRMKRKSAIKIMRPALVHEVESVQRFTREAENASQLSHPNIAAIFDFGESAEGVVYLAMEYIDGHPFSDVLEREGALHPEVAADIIGQAADGLQAAHDLSMLHRDIKPDNIMLGTRPDGTYLVKLVDFGIARVMGGSDQRMTRTGYAVGTPQYMSPEQLAGDTLDARSDQYSLALVAFSALTGKQAFSAESTKESLIQRLTSRPQSLRTAREGVEWPDTLQDVFNKALAPDATERYRTCTEFAEALSVAINSMTPTQTTELYRHALDARSASMVARTPSGAAALAAASGERVVVTRSDGTNTVERTSTTGERVVNPGSVPPSRSRIPMMVGGLLVAGFAAVAFGLRNNGEASAAGVAGILSDSSKPMAVAGTANAAADTLALTQDSAGAGAAVNPSTRTAAPTLPVSPKPGTASPTAAGGAATSAKLAKTKADSTRAAAAKRTKAVEDSIAEVAAARARYPDAPLRALIQRGIDVKAHVVRNNDLRVVVMPTPMFVARAEQAKAWKDANVRADGSRYDAADPIERWTAWNTLVNARRAVYVIEVAPDRTPYPSIEPERIIDFKKGDVMSVEVLRDGAAVALENPAQLPAVLNGTAHQAEGKKVFNSYVATVPASAFAPRDDGKMPRIEVLVTDATRGGGPARIALSDGLVKRLYNEFAPWRDALAR